MGLTWWIALVFSAGTGRLVCVGALLAQLRGGSSESWRLVLTGGGVRTPGRQNNAVPSGLDYSFRIGGEFLVEASLRTPVSLMRSASPAFFRLSRPL
jgi:hypothetical protein